MKGVKKASPRWRGPANSPHDASTKEGSPDTPSVDPVGDGAESAAAPHESATPAHAADEAAPASSADDGVSEDAEEAATDVVVEPARLLPRVHLRGLLEALIFASDKPVASHELAKLALAPLKDVKELLSELRETYAHRGIVLGEVAGGWLFRTSAQFAPFVRELTRERPVKLSRAQLETLAIAAYRQPITRPEIDEIRGVDCGPTLKLLLERELLRILGKKDEPGRPLLYGTTTQFLEFFGLKSLKELPTLREFAELSDESRKVATAALGDVFPAAEATTMAEAAVHTLDGAAAEGVGDSGDLGGAQAASDAGHDAAHRNGLTNDVGATDAADTDAVAADTDDHAEAHDSGGASAPEDSHGTDEMPGPSEAADSDDDEALGPGLITDPDGVLGGWVVPANEKLSDDEEFEPDDAAGAGDDGAPNADADADKPK